MDGSSLRKYFSKNNQVSSQGSLSAEQVEHVLGVADKEFNAIVSAYEAHLPPPHTVGIEKHSIVEAIARAKEIVYEPGILTPSTREQLRISGGDVGKMAKIIQKVNDKRLNGPTKLIVEKFTKAVGVELHRLDEAAYGTALYEQQKGRHAPARA